MSRDHDSEHQKHARPVTEEEHRKEYKKRQAAVRRVSKKRYLEDRSHEYI
jgi:hypothetical protein